MSSPRAISNICIDTNVKVMNLDELNRLTKKAQELSEELQTTIELIQKFKIQVQVD